MKKILTLSLALLFLFSFHSLRAQTVECGTDAAHEKRLTANPETRIAYETFLDQLTQISEQKESDKLYKKKAVLTIPVVFHVMHNYGPENISKAQILNQMETLNKDFRRLNADTSKTRANFRSRAADFEIEFKLATKDPQGNCTDGITRTVTALTDGGDDEVKKLINWDYKKYLNIWVTARVGLAGEEGTVIAGYAYLPYDTDASRDGIIIAHSFVGSIGTSNASKAGRTLTHEVGHWLGLLHPFQDGCGGNCSTTGDRVCDTPPVLKASYGCPLGNNTCSNDSPNEIDNVENFMDYADGTCINMFTNGQKAITQYFLSINTNGRSSNVSSATHAATGIFVTSACAPKADFHTVNKVTTICAGGSITFTDLAWNGNVVDRVWTFEGGTPSSTTIASPTVVYNTPGKFKVTYKVSNALGESVLSKTEFIEVLPAIAGVGSPFVENFENDNSYRFWKPESIGNFGWKVNSGSSYSGSSAMVCVINSNVATGTVFNLYSPAFDLNLHKDLSPKLSFRVAYSLRQTGPGEKLVVYGSSDCGKSWLAIQAFLGASTLASKSGNNPGWSPSSPSDWKVLSVDLSRLGFQRSRSFMMKFEVTSAAGNSVYLDDISIDQFSLSAPQTSIEQLGISIYPNPTAGTFTVQCDHKSEPINIDVFNALGELVFTLVADDVNPKTIQLTQSGIYTLRMYNSQYSTTAKVVVTN